MQYNPDNKKRPDNAQSAHSPRKRLRFDLDSANPGTPPRQVQGSPSTPTGKAFAGGASSPNDGSPATKYERMKGKARDAINLANDLSAAVAEKDAVVDDLRQQLRQSKHKANKAQIIEVTTENVVKLATKMNQNFDALSDNISQAKIRLGKMLRTANLDFYDAGGEQQPVNHPLVNRNPLPQSRQNNEFASRADNDRAFLQNSPAPDDSDAPPAYSLEAPAKEQPMREASSPLPDLKDANLDRRKTTHLSSLPDRRQGNREQPGVAGY